MTTIDRYIQNLFLKNLAIILIVLLSLYAIIEFIEKIDDFIEYRADLFYYLLYPLHTLPTMIANTLPMAVLLSTFATIGGLSRSNQLTAMLGGGISISRISRRLFVISLLLCGILLIGNTWVVPWGTREAEYILETQIKGKNRSVMAEASDLYFRNDQQIVKISRSFPQRGEIRGVTIFSFNDEFKPIKRLQASSGTFQGEGRWLFKDVRIWHFSPQQKNIVHYETHNTMQLTIEKNPQELVQLWNVPEEMTLGELYDIINKLQDEGHNDQAFRIEADLRLARSCIPAIMVLLGVPFALQRGRQSSFSFGVVISLIIFITYYILYAIFAALGAAGVLPPLLAAWSANILMILTGSWMFLHAQD